MRDRRYEACSVGEVRKKSNNGSIADFVVDLYLSVGVMPPGIQGLGISGAGRGTSSHRAGIISISWISCFFALLSRRAQSLVRPCQALSSLGSSVCRSKGWRIFRALI